MTELRPGTSVTPTLRLLRPIGQGGMGRVWVAEHLTLGTEVVVKLMATEVAATADGAARFAREASVAASVKSPHVVQVYDHGVTVDGLAYFVMELLEGHDLAAHLRDHGPMSARDVATLVAQVAKALAKAHQVGVIHRDIKPENIFLCDADGGELFVKLLDFGIAKREQHQVTSAATTTGAVVGTPYYMSPEQIVGEKDIDSRTDIWSLGVVAFEALTGRRPFEGTTVGAITLAIHTGTRRISDYLPDAPVALDDWFSRACARDPRDRFQTAREASVALLEAIGEPPGPPASQREPFASIAGPQSDARTASEPASDGHGATHLSSVFPVPRPARSRPLTIVVAVMAVMVVLIAASVALPALLRPRVPPVEASSNANQLPAVSTTVAAPPVTGSSPGASAITLAPAVPSNEPSAATSLTGPRPAAALTTRSAGAAAARTTQPTSLTKPSKPGKPARTRDDDDIK